MVVDNGESGVDRGRRTEQTDKQPFDRRERRNAFSKQEPPHDWQRSERDQPGDVLRADLIERAAARDVSDVCERSVHAAPSKTGMLGVAAARGRRAEPRSSAITAIGSATCVSSATIGGSACASASPIATSIVAVKRTKPSTR